MFPILDAGPVAAMEVSIGNIVAKSITFFAFRPGKGLGWHHLGNGFNSASIYFFGFIWLPPTGAP